LAESGHCGTFPQFPLQYWNRTLCSQTIRLMRFSFAQRSRASLISCHLSGRDGAGAIAGAGEEIAGVAGGRALWGAVDPADFGEGAAGPEAGADFGGTGAAGAVTDAGSLGGAGFGGRATLGAACTAVGADLGGTGAAGALAGAGSGGGTGFGGSATAGADFVSALPAGAVAGTGGATDGLGGGADLAGSAATGGFEGSGSGAERGVGGSGAAGSTFDSVGGDSAGSGAVGIMGACSGRSAFGVSVTVGVGDAGVFGTAGSTDFGGAVTDRATGAWDPVANVIATR
jgi:hypothetical protein